jgi:hypothetical protein
MRGVAGGEAWQRRQPDRERQRPSDAEQSRKEATDGIHVTHRRMGVLDRDPVCGRDVGQPVAREAEACLGRPERADGRHRWQADPEPGQLGHEEALFEGRVMSNEDRALEAGQELPRYLGEPRCRAEI